jgi:hypothetical protein
MAEACHSDQVILGAKGGKNPKIAPVTKNPKMAMGNKRLRKPGGGK